MKKRANIGGLVALIIGVVATVVTCSIGVAVSVRVSNNGRNWALPLPFTKSVPYEDVTVNADKGKLYCSLENNVGKTTSFKITYKAKKNGLYSTVFNGSLKKNGLAANIYIDKTSGWNKRYFRIHQKNNLSNETTHAYFYAKVV